MRPKSEGAIGNAFFDMMETVTQKKVRDIKPAEFHEVTKDQPGLNLAPLISPTVASYLQLRFVVRRPQSSVCLSVAKGKFDS